MTDQDKNQNDDFEAPVDDADGGTDDQASTDSIVDPRSGSRVPSRRNALMLGALAAIGAVLVFVLVVTVYAAGTNQSFSDVFTKDPAQRTQQQTPTTQAPGEQTEHGSPAAGGEGAQQGGVAPAPAPDSDKGSDMEKGYVEGSDTAREAAESITGAAVGAALGAQLGAPNAAVGAAVGAVVGGQAGLDH